MALDYALTHNPQFPFGALIVDHTKNNITCYGVNSSSKNVLLHGESAAFWNCTKMYPSPTNNDMTNPGVKWSDQTLYTTGEPCPMCASETVYRGVSRVVWGTSIPDLNKSGCAQLMIRMEEVLASYKLGGNVPNHKTPKVEGGILKDDCDSAFWCAFASYRKADYYKKMIQDGNLDYIEDRNHRFNCTE